MDVDAVDTPINGAVRPGIWCTTTITIAREAAFVLGEKVSYYVILFWPGSSLSTLFVGTLVVGVIGCMDNLGICNGKLTRERNLSVPPKTRDTCQRLC